MSQKSNKIFGDRLSKLRSNSGESQEAIASRFNRTRQAAASWEKGVIPREPILSGLANLFGVSTDYLLGLTDDPDKTTYQSPKTISELREGKIAYGDLTDAQKRILARSEEMSEKDQEQFADLAEAFFKTRQDNKKE